MEEDSIDDVTDDDFWEDITNSSLLHHLTEETWETFVKENAKILLVIYDSNCPNCKVLREHLVKCVTMLRSENIEGEIAVLHVDMFKSSIYQLWEPANGVPTIFWFLDGKKQFEYVGSRAAESLLQFFKNPQPPKAEEIFPDWSMQAASDDIYHLDDKGFDPFIVEQNEALVFFYSQSCQSCPKIKPEYEEAATLLDEIKPEATLIAVNIRHGPELKEKYNIHSIPTFLYFKNGKMKFEYHGKTTVEDFVDFMLKPVFIKKQKSDVDWSDESSNIIYLEKDTFLPFTKKHNDVMVMFYAPWCGHCKKFKPEFSKAADILAEKSKDVKLAAFNGNNNKELNSEYDVQGFPSLVYFRNHQYISHYKGKRTAKEVVNFMLSGGEPTKKERSETVDIISGTKPEEVGLLDPGNFTEYMNGHENVMVMFYAPWCGASKKAKDPFFDSALDIAEDLEDSHMVIFDADKHRKFADQFAVERYPTFFYFRNGEKLYEYGGEFAKDSFSEFMMEPREGVKIDAKEDSVQWISEKSDVAHLSRENFDKFLKKHKSVMVFFYINACEYCLNSLKPRYVEAAGSLAQEQPNARLTAINGDWEKPVTNKYNVNAFPTLLYFKNGKMKFKYQGPTDVVALVKFMKNPTEEAARRKKPVSWQDLKPSDYGRIEHLSNTTFDAFVEKYHTAMVMFHSPYYARCIKPREEFKAAAEKLPLEIGMGAVDCHRKPEQGIICYQLKVKTFPSFKYYRTGQYQSEFDGTVAEDFILFLEKKAETKQRDEL